MELHNAFLANYAEERDGLAYVMGGFPEWFTLPSLPAMSLVGIVLNLELDESELETQFELSLFKNEQLFAILKTMRGRVGTDDGAPFYKVVATTLNIEFTEPGLNKFRIVFSDKTLATIPLKVRVIPQWIPTEVPDSPAKP